MISTIAGPSYSSASLIADSSPSAFVTRIPLPPHIFANSGDKIIVTIKTCLEGVGNSNPETQINDVYQNSLTIEYISKKVLEKERALKQEKMSNETTKNQKEKAEMDAL